jgi:hypothetical protein
MLPSTDRPSVSRAFFLAVVVAGALAAVAFHDERTSSFFAGFSAGAGMVFVASFLRNPRKGTDPPDESP